VYSNSPCLARRSYFPVTGIRIRVSSAFFYGHEGVEGTSGGIFQVQVEGPGFCNTAAGEANVK
jgi:hypothetical protein